WELSRYVPILELFLLGFSTGGVSYLFELLLFFALSRTTYKRGYKTITAKFNLIFQITDLLHLAQNAPQKTSFMDFPQWTFSCENTFFVRSGRICTPAMD